MNPSRQKRPAIPDALPERDRIAFAVYDQLAAEVRAAGWAILVRVVGFGAEKRSVMELRRGKSVNVRALKEYATWRADSGQWTRAGKAPVFAATVDRLAALVRAAVAEGYTEAIQPRDVPGRAEKPACRARLGGRKSTAYLDRDEAGWR